MNENKSTKAFVAYMDISGFKKFMEEGRALDVLKNFYNEGFNAINASKLVEGVFISDSGILFIKNPETELKNLSVLLKVICEINKQMLIDDVMLTTSVAYGDFEFPDLTGSRRVTKGPLYGEAYIKAVKDVEGKTSPRIKPGECRILRKTLPTSVKEVLDAQDSDNLKLLMKKSDKHYYFYWMLDEPEKIDDFEKEYEEAYESRYNQILELLKK